MGLKYSKTFPSSRCYYQINNEGGESDGISDVEFDNNYSVKVPNAFTPLFVSKSSPIATLSLPRSSIPAVTTTSEAPHKPNSDQLANSFRKFLQVFKDENSQLKYVETMIEIRSSCLAIDIISFRSRTIS